MQRKQQVPTSAVSDAAVQRVQCSRNDCRPAPPPAVTSAVTSAVSLAALPGAITVRTKASRWFAPIALVYADQHQLDRRCVLAVALVSARPRTGTTSWANRVGRPAASAPVSGTGVGHWIAAVSVALAGVIIGCVVPLYRKDEATMAKRVIYQLIDDINGKLADESVQFALDGVQYEIDLTTENAANLRKSLAPFVDAAARVGRTNRRASSRTRDRSAGTARSYGTGRGRVTDRRIDRQLNLAVRQRAKTNNIPVADRGRIKGEIIDRYHAETGR